MTARRYRSLVQKQGTCLTLLLWLCSGLPVQAHHVAQHAPEVELIWGGGMEPSKTPLDHPFAAPVLAAVGQGHAQEPLAIPAMGGSLPDYVFTKLLGVPAFVTPYANADEANHAPNENLEVERFFKGIRTGAALLPNLGALGLS